MYLMYIDTRIKTKTFTRSKKDCFDEDLQFSYNRDIWKLRKFLAAGSICVQFVS